MPRKPKSRQPFRLYRRDNSPFWWVYFSIKGQQRPHRLSTEVPLASRAEAERAAAALYVGAFDGAGRAGAAVPASIAEQLDMSELAVMWIDQLEREHIGNPRYVSRACTDLEQYITKLWTHPAQITSASWAQKKLELHGAGFKLKWRSIAHLANTLRHFLRFCAARGVIASVPEIAAPTAKQQAGEKAPRRALDEDDTHAFLWALLLLGEERACRIYLALFETWMRKGSLEQLTLRWCDFKAETLTIPPGCNKGRKEKVIDLTPAAAEAIRAEVAGWDVVDLDRPVFGRFDYHQAYDYHQGGLFGRALALAGIDRHGLTPHHSTRHSAASQAGSRPGASLSGLMKQGGWDSAQIVEQNYLHPTLDAARRVTRRTG